MLLLQQLGLTLIISIVHMICMPETVLIRCYYCDEGNINYYCCTHNMYARDCVITVMRVTLIMTIVTMIRTPETVVVSAVI